MTINEAITQLEALAQAAGGETEFTAMGRVVQTSGPVTWVQPVGFWEGSYPEPDTTEAPSRSTL